MEPLPDDDIEGIPNPFTMWFLTSHQKLLFNRLAVFWQFLLLLTYICWENMSVFMLIYLSVMLLSFRIWWIWWWEPTDNIFWISIRIRISSILLLFTGILSWLNIIFLKTAETKPSLIFDICLTYSFPLLSLLVNIINGIRLLKLWYVWYKLTVELEIRREHEDQAFNDIFADREGYSEAREEIEAAGIDATELDEIQRVEIRNARRVLSHFGSRAPQNMNMLRMLFNIDGDRNPEDTEENRVLLFTKIMSLPFNKEKHGSSECCTIWWTEFEEGKYIKILPKCSHLFHEECIEKWIMKAKHGMILCPMWRTDIKQELEIQEQVNSIEAENIDTVDEDSKTSDIENPSNHT